MMQILSQEETKYPNYLCSAQESIHTCIILCINDLACMVRILHWFVLNKMAHFYVN